MSELYKFAYKICINEGIDIEDTTPINNIISTYINLNETTLFNLKSICLMNKTLQKDIDRNIIFNMFNNIDYTPPGQLAKYDRYCVYKNEFHLYTSPNLIKSQLESLLLKSSKTFNRLKNKKQLQGKKKSIIKFGAYFVRDFLEIHPFSDGNGRCAHILLSKILELITNRPITLYELYNFDEFVNGLHDINILQSMIDNILK